MAPSSSGGTTVGEALNILERYDLKSMTPAQAQHLYLEAAHWPSRTAPSTSATRQSTSRSRPCSPTRYAAERACKIDPAARAHAKPVAAGNVAAYDGGCATADQQGRGRAGHRERLTTNLTVADKGGNVVEYTLTIEQTGGSGIVLPGRGFLLNNELTDFSAVYDPADPNRIEPGKRPRSSMSPTIVLKDGKPLPRARLARRLDDHHHGARRSWSTGSTAGCHWPRPSRRRGAAERNTDSCEGRAGLPRPLPARADRAGPHAHAGRRPGTSAAEIGAATAIEFGPGRRLTVAAEPTRRGGGAATVVDAQIRDAAGSTLKGCGTAETWTTIDSVEELVGLLGTPHERARQQGPAALLDVDRDWLAASPFCVMATADADGNCDASPKGDPAGQLVHVIDDRTIAIAERPGNKRADGYRNILANPHVGLNFLIPGRGDTLRINGRARLVSDAPFFDDMVVKGHRPCSRSSSRSTTSSSTARRRSCAPGSGSPRPGSPRRRSRGAR